jgi:hypothetical protein
MQKNYLLGGILLCVFPVMILWVGSVTGFVAQSQGKETGWPLEIFILLAVCFFWGVWTVALSVFKLHMRGAWSYFARSLMVGGLAAMFFVIAWREKTGWSSNASAAVFDRFLPESWGQTIPRVLFAVGGVLATLGAVSLFRKGWKNRCRQIP